MISIRSRDVLAGNLKSAKPLGLKNVFRRHCDGYSLSINFLAAHVPDQDQIVHAT
jgi:hypothetical protein